MNKLIKGVFMVMACFAIIAATAILRTEAMAAEVSDVSSAGNEKTRIEECEIKVSSATLSGKKANGKVSVKDGASILKKDRDYTLTYKNNDSVGRGSVTIKGKGNYIGSVTKNYNILPHKTSITKLTSEKITWEKVDGVSGYVVYYSMKKDGEYKKLVTLSNKKNEYDISKLDSNCYFKMKTYKKVNGKKYYSKYSSVKYLSVVAKDTASQENPYTLEVMITGKKTAEITLRGVKVDTNVEKARWCVEFDNKYGVGLKVYVAGQPQCDTTVRKDNPNGTYDMRMLSMCEYTIIDDGIVFYADFTNTISKDLDDTADTSKFKSVAIIVEEAGTGKYKPVFMDFEEVLKNDAVSTDTSKTEETD